MKMEHFDDRTGQPEYHIRGCRCYFKQDCSWPYCHCEVVYDEKTSRPLRLGEKTRKEAVQTLLVILAIFLTTIILTGAPLPWQW